MKSATAGDIKGKKQRNNNIKKTNLESILCVEVFIVISKKTDTIERNHGRLVQ